MFLMYEMASDFRLGLEDVLGRDSVLSGSACEALEQVAQRCCGCSILGSVQGWLGWDFEQTGFEAGVSTHDNGVGLGHL